MPKYLNEFVEPGHFEHKIQSVDEHGKTSKIGVFRLKPNRVLWKVKGKGKFYSVGLEDFTAWITLPATGATRTVS